MPNKPTTGPIAQPADHRPHEYFDLWRNAEVDLAAFEFHSKVDGTTLHHPDCQLTLESQLSTLDRITDWHEDCLDLTDLALLGPSSSMCDRLESLRQYTNIAMGLVEYRLARLNINLARFQLRLFTTFDSFLDNTNIEPLAVWHESLELELHAARTRLSDWARGSGRRAFEQALMHGSNPYRGVLGMINALDAHENRFLVDLSHAGASPGVALELLELLHGAEPYQVLLGRDIAAYDHNKLDVRFIALKADDTEQVIAFALGLLRNGQGLTDALTLARAL